MDIYIVLTALLAMKYTDIVTSCAQLELSLYGAQTNGKTTMDHDALPYWAVIGS